MGNFGKKKIIILAYQGEEDIKDIKIIIHKIYNYKKVDFIFKDNFHITLMHLIGLNQKDHHFHLQECLIFVDYKKRKEIQV
jgi:hypothetical protein